ncbi:MAG: multidrug efflux system outer membrane protein [Candidatus Omnitrophota bacterium]|jgi:multidrug efflux system outer membrane protein
MHMRCVILLLAAWTMTGCIGPRSSASRSLPDDPVPEHWAAASDSHAGQISAGWLKTFQDPTLEALVAAAMQHNRNLQLAAARLLVAREQAVGAGAARRPQLRAAFNPSRSLSENGDEPSTDDSSYRLGLDTSWELDLWGRLRDLDEAAQLDLSSAEAVFRNAQLSLAANTAKAWFNFITAEQQVQAAESTRESFQRNHRITERNYKAGDPSATPLNVQFGRTNVASAERSLVRARFNRDEAARALEVLIGHYPAAEMEGRSELPELPIEVPAGLPAELLMRRPDLASAAASLSASAYRADAADKELLPSVRFTGGVSSADDSLGRMLVDPETFVWNIASSLSHTIYQGGAPSAAARRALAENEVAIRSFADQALRAFREVESAMALERSLAEQEAFLKVEQTQANLAEAQAARDYSEGLVDIISLLEAQRRAVNARNDMIALRNQRLQNRVDLHLALGGDFDTVAP